MPHYDFKKDLPVAQKTEKEISNMLFEKYGWKTLHMSGSKGYDLYLQKGNSRRLVEVKEDFSCEKTGNVGLEFECRGKPSGIRTTKASHYIYKVHTKDNGIVYLLLRKEILLKMIKNKKFHRVVSGGDKGSNSMNFLFTYDVFRKHAVKLFE